MFIDSARSKFLIAPAERNGGLSSVPLLETLRSAGARTQRMTGVYKHLAPLEPGLRPREQYPARILSKTLDRDLVSCGY